MTEQGHTSPPAFRAPIGLTSLPATPTIVPLRTGVTAAEVDAVCAGDAPIYACDFYIVGAEDGALVAGGLALGRILNVDHHAPIAPMERAVTSTLLAAELLASRGGIEPGAHVVINHTDCDSILSSAFLLGLVEPDEDLLAASVCADHTGAPHPVADLLQALDEGRRGLRTREQYLESVRNLRSLLAGEPLEPVAERALESRRARRAAAARLVGSGEMHQVGALAYGVIDEEIDGAFFPALFPTAAMVMLAVRHPANPDRWAVKLRLGLAAPPGFTLPTLDLASLDPGFGGRWNAGSNKRGGGTAMAPDEYAREVARRVEELV